MKILERRAATALFRILRACRDTRPWIVPVNACPVVAWCFQAADVPMLPVDLDHDTYMLSEHRALELVTQRRAGGLLFIRTYGRLDDRSAFFRSVRAIDSEITIVDDRALCEPDPSAELQDGVDALLFSSGPRKPVDLGWGGLCILREGTTYASDSTSFSVEVLDEVDRHVKRSIHAGEPFEITHSRWLDARVVAATDAAEWHRRVHEEIAAARIRRSSRNARYREVIPRANQLGDAWNTWRFQVRVGRPDILIAALASVGLFASRHYASLGHSIEPERPFPVAEALERDVVNLFNDHSMSIEMVDRTASIVARHAAAYPLREHIRSGPMASS